MPPPFPSQSSVSGADAKGKAGKAGAVSKAAPKQLVWIGYETLLRARSLASLVNHTERTNAAASWPRQAAVSSVEPVLHEMVSLPEEVLKMPEFGCALRVANDFQTVRYEDRTLPDSYAAWQTQQHELQSLGLKRPDQQLGQDAGAKKAASSRPKSAERQVAQRGGQQQPHSARGAHAARAQSWLQQIKHQQRADRALLQSPPPPSPAAPAGSMPQGASAMVPWVCGLSHPYTKGTSEEVRRLIVIVRREARLAAKVLSKLSGYCSQVDILSNEVNIKKTVFEENRGLLLHTFREGDNYFQKQHASKFGRPLPEDTVLVFDAAHPPAVSEVLKLLGGETGFETPRRYNLVAFNTKMCKSRPDGIAHWMETVPRPGRCAGSSESARSWVANLPAASERAERRVRRRPKGKKGKVQEVREPGNVLTAIRAAALMGPRRIWVTAHHDSAWERHVEAETTLRLLRTCGAATAGAGVPYMVQQVVLFKEPQRGETRKKMRRRRSRSAPTRGTYGKRGSRRLPSRRTGEEEEEDYFESEGDELFREDFEEQAIGISPFWMMSTGDASRVQVIDHEAEIEDLDRILKDIRARDKVAKRAEAAFDKARMKLPAFKEAIRRKMLEQGTIEKLLRADLEECRQALRRNGGVHPLEPPVTIATLEKHMKAAAGAPHMFALENAPLEALMAALEKRKAARKKLCDDSDTDASSQPPASAFGAPPSSRDAPPVRAQKPSAAKKKKKGIAAARELRAGSSKMGGAAAGAGEKAPDAAPDLSDGYSSESSVPCSTTASGTPSLPGSYPSSVAPSRPSSAASATITPLPLGQLARPSSASLPSHATGAAEGAAAAARPESAPLIRTLPPRVGVGGGSEAASRPSSAGSHHQFTTVLEESIGALASQQASKEALPPELGPGPDAGDEETELPAGQPIGDEPPPPEQPPEEPECINAPWRATRVTFGGHESIAPAETPPEARSVAGGGRSRRIHYAYYLHPRPPPPQS